MYFGRSVDFESAKMTIDVVNDGAISTGNIYPQPQRTGVLYNAYLIKPTFKTNLELLCFFSTTIQKSVKLKFGYENKASWEKVKNERIKLPIKNNQIDFDFMEEFIAELEAERIAELEAYLSVTGLKDYNLTKEEQRVLGGFENGTIELNEYSINELFKINSSVKRFDANKVFILNVGYPYIVRTGLNNGIRGYLDEDIRFLNKGNTISFGQDTATMFYQEKPYFTGDKIKILKSKSKFFNKNNAHFFIAGMTKVFSCFSWGSSSFNVNIIKDQKIKLPTKNNQPDYAMINIFISAIQKLVIKDVVLYADRKINATKNIVGNNHIV